MSNDPSIDGHGSDEPAGDLEAEVARLREENERLRAGVVEHDVELRASHSRRRRGTLAIVMVVVGAILAPVAVLTVWTRNQVLDTDRYVETVQPLADDPVIVSSLSNRISAKIADELDVKSLAQDALPENAAFLAAPIAAGADNLIHTATTRLLESERFQKAWTEANRVAHDGLVAVLTGRKGEVVSTENGQVVIRLQGVVEEVLKGVDDQFGVDISSRVPTDKLNVNFVLVDSKQLADVQVAVRWLDRLSWFAVIASLGLLVGSIFVAPDHRKGLRRAGLGLAISMFVLFVGFGIGRDVYLTNLPDGVQRPDAAAVVFDTLTRFVLQAVRTLFVIGVVLFLAAVIAGPSTFAVKLRELWNRALGRGGSLAGDTVDLGPVPAFVARHLMALRVAVFAIAALILVMVDRPTGKVVLAVALCTLIPLAILQVLAGAGRDRDEVAPGPPAGTTAGADT